MDAFKVVQIVYRNNGENCGSHTPYCSLVHAQTQGIDLDTEEYRCMNSGDDRQILDKIYIVKDIVIPTWMDADYYCDQWVAFKYLWGRNSKTAELPEAEQMFLKDLDAHRQVSYGKLLCVKKFRSDFRKAMAEQVRLWINSTERKYNQPLSYRQYECIADRHFDSRIDNTIYWSRTAKGVEHLTSKLETVKA